MAVLTTCILVGLGFVALAGTGAYLLSKDDVETERLNNRLAEISNEINLNNTLIEKYNTIKGKIQNAIDYLDNGKRDFANGGHVLDNTPLANTEFLNTNKKLNQSITDINNINKELNNNIETLKQERSQINAKLAELNG